MSEEIELTQSSRSTSFGDQLSGDDDIIDAPESNGTSKKTGSTRSKLRNAGNKFNSAVQNVAREIRPKEKAEKVHQLLLRFLTGHGEDVPDGSVQKTMAALGAEERNHLLHIAAQHNRLDRLNDANVMQNFNAEIDGPNKKGETALHLAAASGGLEAVQILLDHHANVDSRDERRYSPLHSALRTRKPNPKVIRLLVQTFESTSSSSSDSRQWTSDQVDNQGNTPLHIAAIYMRTSYDDCVRCVEELKVFNPQKTNLNGDSALHVAAKRGNLIVLEAMLQVFYAYNQDVGTHVKDRGNNSLLDICAMNVETEMVTLLLDYGADPRDGLLYKLVDESMRMPEKTEDLRKIYKLIVDNVDKWSEKASRTDILDLLLVNRTKEELKDKLNVLEYAVEEGSVQMLEELLRTEALYERQDQTSQSGSYTFRVNYCTPSRQRISLLERISNYQKEKTAAEMLYVQPLRHIASFYLWYSTLVYTVFFVCQSTFMILFSIFCIPNACQLSRHFRSNATDCNAGDALTSDVIIRNKVGFIFWPLVTLIGTICVKACQCKRFVFVKRLELTAHLFSMAFGTIVIVWFAVLVQASDYESYTEITAALFICGWLQAFRYLSYLGEMYIFANLVTEIICRDVLKLASILVFIVVGFGLAIQSLNQTELIGNRDRSITDTIYFTFSAILNLGPLYDDTLDDGTFPQAGGDLVAMRVVLLIYLIATFIILLNILIAMMSDTYQSNNKRSKAMWKLSVLKVSLSFLLIKREIAKNPSVSEKVTSAIIRTTPVRGEDGDSDIFDMATCLTCECSEMMHKMRSCACICRR